MEMRDALQRCYDLPSGDEPRALELSWRTLVARAPQEIVMVEAVMRIVPAAIANVIIDDAIRRLEFVDGMRKAGDHHNRRAGCPGEP